MLSEFLAKMSLSDSQISDFNHKEEVQPGFFSFIKPPYP
jgi:hypothetical protein